MNTISLVRPEVNPGTPVRVVVEWAEKQADKGDMGGASARLRLTSLRQMAEQVASDEPDDAQWILDNIERLRDRWARKNLGGKSGTARTYASRAKTTIEEFFRWAESPSTYDPKRPPARSERKAADKPTTAPLVEQVTASTPSAQSQSVNLPGAMHRISLGGGREFLYTPPSDGLQMRDAIRIGYNMITQCEDYDPTTMTPAQAFSGGMQRTQ